ncbi:MAG: hypothetical protein WA996_21205, partial [Candidatus Promineifilaceae bacterium]
MSRVIIYIAAFIVFMHGLVHLLYFVSYWPIAVLEEVPYKTTLLNGRWDVGPDGIRLFGLLCLTTTVAFIVAAIGLATKTGWWRPVMAIMAVFSLVTTSLDWSVAYGGPVVNVIILALVLSAS